MHETRVQASPLILFQNFRKKGKKTRIPEVNGDPKLESTFQWEYVFNVVEI